MLVDDRGGGVDPGKPTLLFLHGAGMDHAVWEGLARRFPERGVTVLVPDLPGHGPAGPDGRPRSEGPPLATVEAMADWLVRLLDDRGIAAAGLVGHSMGALVALAAAARHPDRVSRLALLGAAARMPVNPDLLNASRDDRQRAEALILSWGFASTESGGAVPNDGPIGRVRRTMAAAPDGVLHADLAACDAYRGGADAAARVACPCLVLCGGLDRMTPAKAGAALAALVPGATLTVLDDAGHMMTAERPEATFRALTDRPFGTGL